MKNILFGILVFLAFSVYAQPKDTSVVETNNYPDLSFVEIYEAKLLEHFHELDLFTTDRNELNVLNLPVDSFPRYPDQVFIDRIEKMDENSPFDFVFNESTGAMIKMYAYKRRRYTSKMLTYGELYFPLFEEHLIKHEMPLELKYLPIVESALNPKATSRSGARGLWQFMPKTGMIYNLEISSYVDKRCDPYLASDAACRYLKKLHSIYGNWSMALAAYNAGPGTVNKAIRRSGGKTTYWEIREFLPKETQGYVPAFTAVNYVMNYAVYHNVYPREPEFMNVDIDTLQVHERIDFHVMHGWIGYELEKIQYLNPMFKQDIMPKPDSTYTLYLPKDVLGQFMYWEDSIYKYSSLKHKHMAAAMKPRRIESFHVVKKGETVETIAKLHQCESQEVKAWNNMSSGYLRTGRKLRIYVKDEGVVPQVSDVKDDPSPNNGLTLVNNITYYTIKKGDTLWDIAKRHNGVSVEDIKRLNSGLDLKNLKSGTKIKIQKRG